MNDFELKKVRELFSRLFVVGINNKINLNSFTSMLEKSEFIHIIEQNTYSEYFNREIKNIFYEITGFSVKEDNSYGVYNDAYWCGQNYFDLHIKLKKSFSYIFLKLPLNEMIDMYPIYHEMDFSALVERFKEKEKETTIIKALCIKKGCSLVDLSENTLISINTLKKYNTSDEMIFAASFQNINKICNYFDVQYNLFAV